MKRRSFLGFLGCFPFFNMTKVAEAVAEPAEVIFRAGWEPVVLPIGFMLYSLDMLDPSHTELLIYDGKRFVNYESDAGQAVVNFLLAREK